MDLAELREQVCAANRALVANGLVTLSFGNASGVDRAAGVMVIKPSGVAYDRLTPGDMVVVSLADGVAVQGALRPSSDTPTHLVLYRAFRDDRRCRSHAFLVRLELGPGRTGDTLPGHDPCRSLPRVRAGHTRS